jgi:hypothetical protein
VRLDRDTLRWQGVNEYRSPHWSESNVVAHTRFNDRVDSEGKRTLFIEEIQSDWHQAGREKGYKGEVKPPDITARQGSLGPRSWLLTINGLTSTWEASTADEAIAKAQEGWERNTMLSGVPPAPFSKTWHEMAFRRMVRWAAENGYDSLAWTTGEQQAERYDLSKQVDQVRWYKENAEGSAYALGAIVKDSGLEQSIGKGILKEKLPDYVGKELAQKIVNESSEKFSGVYEGADLKIGGEGMKGFYDQILVNYANKFGKRFGAKAGEVKILTNPADGGGTPIHVAEYVQIHSLPITDSMRESVGKGIALFHPDMENADNRALYDSLIRKAANYDTAEEFQKDME